MSTSCHLSCTTSHVSDEHRRMTNICLRRLLATGHPAAGALADPEGVEALPGEDDAAFASCFPCLCKTLHLLRVSPAFVG